MRNIKLKIIENKEKDSKTVAKIVLLDNQGRALFLKRSNYMKKFAGDWDLPGGHLKINENLLSGLKREVSEETSLTFENPIFIKKIKNIYFFYAKYNSQKIVLSDEHKDYRFFQKNNLDPERKFHKVALMAMEAANV
tara:strand:- start:1020 stop:1430 length:411 start_codon:yes stop_codon:yes gene_type:complete